MKVSEGISRGLLLSSVIRREECERGFKYWAKQRYNQDYILSRDVLYFYSKMRRWTIHTPVFSRIPVLQFYFRSGRTDCEGSGECGFIIADEI